MQTRGAAAWSAWACIRILARHQAHLVEADAGTEKRLAVLDVAGMDGVDIRRFERVDQNPDANARSGELGEGFDARGGRHEVRRNHLHSVPGRAHYLDEL